MTFKRVFFSSTLGQEGVDTSLPSRLTYRPACLPASQPANYCMLVQFFSCPRAPKTQRQPRRAAVAGMCPGTEHSVCQRKKAGGDLHRIGPTASAARRPGSGLAVGAQRWATMHYRRKHPLLSRLCSFMHHRTQTSVHTKARSLTKKKQTFKLRDTKREKRQMKRKKFEKHKKRAQMCH